MQMKLIIAKVKNDIFFFCFLKIVNGHLAVGCGSSFVLFLFPAVLLLGPNQIAPPPWGRPALPGSGYRPELSVGGSGHRDGERSVCG